jgi:hypothetical protein
LIIIVCSPDEARIPDFAENDKEKTDEVTFPAFLIPCLYVSVVKLV